MLTTLMKSFRLKRVQRQIQLLERHEAELKRSLDYVRNRQLPALRQTRNDMLFGRPQVKLGWSERVRNFSD